MSEDNLENIMCKCGHSIDDHNYSGCAVDVCECLRYRELLITIDKETKPFRLKIEALKAEIEQLLATLEKLATIDVDDGEYNSVWEQMYAVKTIARAALEVTK